MEAEFERLGLTDGGGGGRAEIKWSVNLQVGTGWKLAHWMFTSTWKGKKKQKKKGKWQPSCLLCGRQS